MLNAYLKNFYFIEISHHLILHFTSSHELLYPSVSLCIISKDFRVYIAGREMKISVSIKTCRVCLIPTGL